MELNLGLNFGPLNERIRKFLFDNCRTKKLVNISSFTFMAYRKHFLPYTGIIIWNSIPCDIRSSPSEKLFVKIYKRMLLEEQLLLLIILS